MSALPNINECRRCQLPGLAADPKPEIRTYRQGPVENFKWLVFVVCPFCRWIGEIKSSEPEAIQAWNQEQDEPI